MKIDKKVEEQKELIRLKEERYEIWNAIRNQNLVEMDKPIAHGWDGYWVLRDDISRSPESEILQYILDTYGCDVWCRRKDFKVKSWRTKKLVDVKPSFSDISERTYEELSDKMKSYFILITRDRYSDMWWRPRYKVNIDTWKLEMETKRSYLTHYREHDEILYQMESENEYNMYKNTPVPWGGYRSPRWWKRTERRKAKTKHRAENRVLINSYNNGEELADVYTSYKTHSMHYW